MFHEVKSYRKKPPEVFLKKDFLKSFASLLESLSFGEKRPDQRCFSVKFVKCLGKSILKNICKRLLLIIEYTLEFSMKCFLQEDVQKGLVVYLYATSVFDKWILKLLFGFATTKMFTFPREVFSIPIDAIKTEI